VPDAGEDWKGRRRSRPLFLGQRLWRAATANSEIFITMIDRGWPDKAWKLGFGGQMQGLHRGWADSIKTLGLQGVQGDEREIGITKFYVAFLQSAAPSNMTLQHGPAGFSTSLLASCVGDDSLPEGS